MRVTRSAFALPLVLVGGFLLASLVITFHFVSASDTRSVNRMLKSVQAGLLADIASDEIVDQVAAITSGANATNQPQWVKDLYRDLNKVKNQTPPLVVDNPKITFDLSKLELTKKAAEKSSGTLTVKSIEGRLGPFSYTCQGEPFVYKDPEAFGDDKKDLRAYDFRGPLSVEVAVNSDRGPFDFSQKYLRGQELMITDTSPPAHEFALFSYLPPPSESYALNDMGTGMQVNVNAGKEPDGSARVHVRGPLFIMAEDPPVTTADAQHPWLSKPGDKPQDITPNVLKSTSYPDGVYTAGFGAVPGPRVLHHTDGSTSAIDGALGGIKDAFDGAVEGLSPRRVEGIRSETNLKTHNPPFQFQLNITANITETILGREVTLFNGSRQQTFGIPVVDWKMHEISLVLSNNFTSTGGNTTFETLDRDSVGYYPPAAYLYGPATSGTQKFSIKPALGAVNPKSYRGVLAPAKVSEKYKQWKGSGQLEGDLITAEPVPVAADLAGANVGLIGVYGVVLFESHTVLFLPVKRFAEWMIQKFIDTFPGIDLIPYARRVAMQNKDKAIERTLTDLKLAPSLSFVIRRFRSECKPQFAGTKLDDLASHLTDRSAFIAPYGTYWHTADFFRTNSPIPQAIRDACQKALKEPLDALKTEDAAFDALKDLLPKGKEPDFTPKLDAIDPTWKIGEMPEGQTPAKDFREWMCTEYQGSMLKRVLPTAGNAPTTNLANLIALAKPTKAIGDLNFQSAKRPQGVMGDYQTNGPGAGAPEVPTAKEYPTGFYPPRYREWDKIITKRYPDMKTYLKAEVRGQVLELNGAVLIEKMDTDEDIGYHGRGIIVCYSDDKQVARCEGKVAPKDPNDTTSLLTLVHRVPGPMLKDGRAPQIKLGVQFRGSVYSDSGVKPKTTTEIYGNLVCGLLEKGVNGGGDTVEIIYAKDADRLDCPPDKMTERWTVDMTGEVSSAQPSP